MLVLMLCIVFFVIILPVMMTEFTDPGHIFELFNKKPKYDYQTQLSFLDHSLWIKKVINSCTTSDQVRIVYKLIRIFKKRYLYKIDPNLYKNVCNDVENCWDKKETAIIYNIYVKN